jgi:hypothetical protein
VVEDGYGVCYTFREHDLNVSITNFISNHATDCKRFVVVVVVVVVVVAVVVVGMTLLSFFSSFFLDF